MNLLRYGPLFIVIILVILIAGWAFTYKVAVNLSQSEAVDMTGGSGCLPEWNAASCASWYFKNTQSKYWSATPPYGSEIRKPTVPTVPVSSADVESLCRGVSNITACKIAFQAGYIYYDPAVGWIISPNWGGSGNTVFYAIGCAGASDFAACTSALLGGSTFKETWPNDVNKHAQGSVSVTFMLPPATPLTVSSGLSGGVVGGGFSTDLTGKSSVGGGKQGEDIFERTRSGGSTNPCAGFDDSQCRLRWQISDDYNQCMGTDRCLMDVEKEKAYQEWKNKVASSGGGGGGSSGGGAPDVGDCDIAGAGKVGNVSLYPTAGLAGTQVTLAGWPATSVSSIKMGGENAVITSRSSGNQITFTVPAGLSLGRYEVMLILSGYSANSGRACGLLENGGSFTVTGQVLADDISCNLTWGGRKQSDGAGIRRVGEDSNWSIQVRGLPSFAQFVLTNTNLNDGRSISNTPLSANQNGRFDLSDNTPIPSEYTSGAYKTELIFGSTRTACSPSFVIEGGTTTIAGRVPQISSFSPLAGKAGDIITIKGSNFTTIGGLGGRNTIYLNNRKINAASVSRNGREIGFIIPDDLKELLTAAPFSSAVYQVKVRNGSGHLSKPASKWLTVFLGGGSADPMTIYSISPVKIKPGQRASFSFSVLGTNMSNVAEVFAENEDISFVEGSLRVARLSGEKNRVRFKLDVDGNTIPGFYNIFLVDGGNVERTIQFEVEVLSSSAVSENVFEKVLSWFGVEVELEKGLAEEK